MTVHQFPRTTALIRRLRSPREHAVDQAARALRTAGLTLLQMDRDRFMRACQALLWEAVEK